MKDIKADVNHIAFCGLYCGACNRFLKGGCPGCQKNEKATWCKIRNCCLENELKSCADCSIYNNPEDCKYFSGLISKLFGFIFQSNRVACVNYISEHGYEKFAAYMAENNLQSIKR